MKFWMGIILACVAVLAFNSYQETERKNRYAAKEAACQADPVCSAMKANRKALYQSYGKTYPVQSTTGKMFFKGEECLRDCSGHVAGYEWAEERGISKEEGCRGNSQSFIDGCLIYVAERLDELREGDDSDEDLRDSCTPGRYGDC